MTARCDDCFYLQEERTAIHQHDGKMPRLQAEELGRRERCHAHALPPRQSELAAMMRAEVEAATNQRDAWQRQPK